jgi:chromosome partitioning protein
LPKPRTTPSAAKLSSSLNPWGSSSARIISFISHKGGVGKTTSTVNLGAAFALSKHKTLLIGLDPQCGLSLTLGFDKTSLNGGLKDVLSTGLPLTKVIHTTPLENLSLLSPNAWSMAQEDQYKISVGKYGVLGELLEQVRQDFDTILIDCPPGFGPETRAALTVSDSFIIPVQAEELCHNTVNRMLNFIRDFKPVAKKGLLMEGLFLTMTDARIRMSREVTKALSKEFKGDVFKTAIPRAARLAEMASQGKPTVIYDRRGRGSIAYFNLMDEIIKRHSKRPAQEVQPQPHVSTQAPVKSSAKVEKPSPQTKQGNGSSTGPVSRIWNYITRRGNGRASTGM